MSLPITPSQTVGPYFHIGLSRLTFTDLTGAKSAGERVSIEGRILDGNGRPVDDALVEIWQANAKGEYFHPMQKPSESDFRGFGRVATDESGHFGFVTIKSGRVPGPGGMLQAPHIVVVISMRGLLKHLVTRIYFPDESSNQEDPILRLVPSDRRGTLIAKNSSKKAQALEWNVILQGINETVFFDY